MILESIVTTTNADGTMNVSPMGPWVENDLAEGFELRPWDTSTTFANLQQRGFGVLHVTDDVLLFAQAAIGQLGKAPNHRPALQNESAYILSDACRWYEFEVSFVEASNPRKSIRCKTVATGRQRDFFGFNRAKHAVIEAAILATRIDFLPAGEIESQMPPLATIVSKTGGPQEVEAFAMIDQFINSGKPNSR